MQESVDLSRGLIAYYRHEISKAAVAKPMNTARIEELRPMFEDAIKLEAVVSKAAVDAGVAGKPPRNRAES